MRLRRHVKTFVLIAIIASLGGSVAGTASIFIQKTGTSSGRSTGTSHSAGTSVGGTSAGSGGLVSTHARANGNASEGIFEGARVARVVYFSEAPSGGVRGGIIGAPAVWRDWPAAGVGYQPGYGYAMRAAADYVAPTVFHRGLQWTTNLISGAAANGLPHGSTLPLVSGMGSGGTSGTGSGGSPALSPALLTALDTVNHSPTSLRVPAVAAPVPEPAEWIMLAVGVAVVAFIVRRRRIRG